MAFEDFWRNVLGAAPVHPLDLNEIPPDVRPIAPEDIRKALKRNTQWLKPWSVAGFGSSDLTFLPSDERAKLTGWVDDFHAIATLAQDWRKWTPELLVLASDKRGVLDFARNWKSGVRGDSSVHELQDDENDAIRAYLVELAAPLMEKIILFLEVDHFLTAEAFRIGKQIDQKLAAEPTPEVDYLRYRTGEDWMGEPGIWIWVYLSELAMRSEAESRAAADRLRWRLHEITRTVTKELFPYIAFRSAKETVGVAV